MLVKFLEIKILRNVLKKSSDRFCWGNNAKLSTDLCKLSIKQFLDQFSNVVVDGNQRI